LHDCDVTEFDDLIVMLWGIMEVYDCDIFKLWMIELGFDCIIWIGGIWERWSCWIMDLIGATYYNLKLFLTIVYSKSTN